MKLNRNPFLLMFTRGDETTQLACLALFGLGDSPLGRACQEAIRAGQRPDGTFPSRIDAAHWGMLETARHPLLLLDAGSPPDDAAVSGAVRFILNHQNPDGGWCENPALEIPPQTAWVSNKHTITWLTADEVQLLRSVGRAEQPPCQAALTGLRATQDRQGGWPSVARDTARREDDLGDPDATAQITFLLSEICGEEDPAYRDGRDLFERHLDQWAQDVERGYSIRRGDRQRQALDVYTLTHLLLSCLVDAPRRLHTGYDVGDPRVARGMAKLVEIQREDGGWAEKWSTAAGSSAWT